MVKRFLFCILFLLFFFLPVSAEAAQTPAFHPVITAEQGRDGDVVDLVLTYDGSLGEIGAFLAQVEYDGEKLSYVRTGQSQAIQAGYVTTAESEGKVGSAYTMKTPETCLSAAGDTFTYRFRVREGAQPGKTGFFVSVYQIVDTQPVFLGHDTDEALDYTVLPPPSSDATLLSLTPETGELEPPFSPDCFSYAMKVPFETKSVTFQAEAAQGAYFRVNRKNLGAGGSDTEFLLTVTAEDDETKQVYRIVVHREEKTVASPSAGPTVSSKPTASPPERQTSKPAEQAVLRVTARPTTAPKAAASASPEASEPAPTAETTKALASSQKPGPSVVSTVEENQFSTPGLTIQNGSGNSLGVTVALVFLLVMIWVSGPLAKRICRLTEKSPEEKEDREGEDEDEEL